MPVCPFDSSVWEYRLPVVPPILRRRDHGAVPLVRDILNRSELVTQKYLHHQLMSRKHTIPKEISHRNAQTECRADIKDRAPLHRLQLSFSMSTVVTQRECQW